MLDMTRVGGQIALMRKERGLTQDALAERLNISAQAVSKWENGRTLPETALLPALSKLLDCTIDSLLMPNGLQILEAVYSDGNTSYNVTARLNKYVEGDRLELPVNEKALLHPAGSDRIWFLMVKYKDKSGAFYTAARYGDNLVISGDTTGDMPSDKPMAIIDAYYGNNEYAYNAMQKIRHYDFFRPDRYHANHESFPSNPMVTGPEYLSIVYLNDTGLHLAVCGERESLAVSSDGKDLYREPESAESWSIPKVESLRWGAGMDCSWAGALTVALRAMGHLNGMSLEEAFIHVMGVSGACYRLAFSSPTWDYSSVDGLVAYDYASPAYKAFGYTPVFADRVDKKQREDERANILRSIRHNMPVLAINLRVAPEWGVITGYEDSGKTLLCRTYYDDADRYLPVDNWPFIITHFGPETRPPAEKENLAQSLRVMIECSNIPDRGGYSMGYKAYETWAADLRDDKRFEVDDGTFWRLYSVNHFCMMALTDARRCAWKYLEKSAEIYGGAKSQILTEMAGNFEMIHKEVAEVFGQLCDLCPSEAPKAKQLWPRDLRMAQADAFDKACRIERMTEALAVRFLEEG